MQLPSIDHPTDPPTTLVRMMDRARCPECGRVFDLADEDDAAEWAYGHDCEAPE